jgi:hypothetical protein
MNFVELIGRGKLIELRAQHFDVYFLCWQSPTHECKEYTETREESCLLPIPDSQEHEGLDERNDAQE